LHQYVALLQTTVPPMASAPGAGEQSGFVSIWSFRRLGNLGIGQHLGRVIVVLQFPVGPGSLR